MHSVGLEAGRDSPNRANRHAIEVTMTFALGEDGWGVCRTSENLLGRPEGERASVA